jgi:hypothetical protein
MPRQIINIGAAPNDRSGDKLRDAGTKMNANFSELYAGLANTQIQVANLVSSIGSGNTGIQTEETWNDPVANVSFSVVPWVSGKTVQIESTPFEFSNVTMFNTQTDSTMANFTWDQNFIDNVYEGGPDGIDGENYSVSFDGGSTWYALDAGGYSGGSNFYFYVPFENEGLYTFTYTTGQSAILRYNRGNTFEPWFDLTEAPISNTNNVLFATMKVFARGRGFVANTVAEGYKYFDTFSLGLDFDQNGNQGYVIYSNESTQGNQTIANALNIRARLASNPNAIFCTYDYRDPGEITVFWDARLYVRN